MASRWPEIRLRWSTEPFGRPLRSGSGVTSLTLPVAGTPWSVIFQASTRASAPMPARVCEVVSKVPMLAMPVETVLKPFTCAPTTARSMPPARPSKIWP